MAADTQAKRKREEEEEDEEQERTQKESLDTMRQKSYNYILSLLEEEEDEPIEDPSPLITSLQEELSSDSHPLDSSSLSSNSDLEIPSNTLNEYPPSATTTVMADQLKQEEEEGEMIMRHLLHASDDELGLPSTELNSDTGEELFNGGDAHAFGDDLWEFEDEAVASYHMWQSDPFLVPMEEQGR